MSTLTEPGPFDALAKAEPTEPMFPLLARDPDAPATVTERIRLAGIDAPELQGSPRCSPASFRRLAGSANPPWCDPQLAERSRDELRRLLAHGRVEIDRRGQDRYGRTLANVRVNGRDVGEVLVSMGLARRWVR